MYFGDHKLTKKWGIHLEAQVRRHQLISSAQQILLRTGINYHFTDNSFFTAGYCFVETNKYGKFPSLSDFPEHRLWQQVQVKNQSGRLEIVNRYRLEQRFVFQPIFDMYTGKYNPAKKPTYSNRMRLMTRVSIPFKGEMIKDKSLYLSFYDEVFINFGKNILQNHVDQNRAYLAIGYKIPKLGRLEIGYLNQLLIKSDGLKIENNHTLQLGLSSVLNFYKND